MAIATLNDKYQVVIPKAMREYIGVKKGVDIEIIPVPLDKYLIVRPVQKNNKNTPLSAYAGLAQGMYGNVDTYIARQKASWEKINKK